MNCSVVDVHGNYRPVKNLGWLLRHRDEVVSFDVRVPKIPTPGCDVLLVARLQGERHFHCRFASRAVLAGFLCKRRAWRTLRVLWLGEEGMVGKHRIVGLSRTLQVPA